MKFKLVEKFDETRSVVQDYMYDAIEELNNASLEEYIQWFKSELTYYDERVEQAVTDAYIEACDYGMIRGVEKTRLTSELKEYIESNADLIDDTDELMKQCPDHLQHELKIVLSKLNESLNEALPSPFKKRLYDFIKEHHDLLNNDVDELYLLCPVGLKRDLVELLNSANIQVNKDLINKFEFLVTEYNPQDLDRIVIDNGGYVGTTTNNVEYIITNWDKFDFPAYKELNEDLLTEATRAPKRIIYEARFDTPDAKDAIEIFSDDYDKFKELLDKYRRLIKTVTNIRVHLLKFVKKTYKFPDIEAPFTVSDASQLDSHVPQSFRKSIDDNKVDISSRPSSPG